MQLYNLDTTLWQI